jgi:NDP-sugar pyrophosphorylase family protein
MRVNCLTVTRLLLLTEKIITDIDLNAAFATHRRTNAIATLVLLPNVACEKFSVVKTAGGFLQGFGGMPLPADFPDDPPLMFTGIQILEPKIFDYIPRGVFSHSTTDVYPQAIAKGERVAVHVAAGRWLELSTIQRYLDISLLLLAETGEPFTSGQGCQVLTEADVQQSVLWDRVVVGSGARVRRAVLADNVQIPPGEVIENAVVVPATLIQGKTPPPKALKGEIRGDNFVVPLAE